MAKAAPQTRRDLLPGESTRIPRLASSKRPQVGRGVPVAARCVRSPHLVNRSPVPDRSPDLVAIQRAAVRIRGWATRTPAIPAPELSRVTGAQVYVKLESLQLSGSFKIRGARNAVFALTADERAHGVITVSTGNHGRALATAARDAGIRCVVCLSTLVPKPRIVGIRALGAEVVVAGSSQDEAAEVARRMVRTEGLTLVHPFDDPRIIAGQGTIALELASQVPRLDTVLVPVSGGGLIAGMAIVLDALVPHAEVIGVSSAACPAMALSIEAGHPVEVAELSSIADNLGGGIGSDNRYTFETVQRLVDRHLVVDDQEVRIAMRRLFDDLRVVAEGAGAVATAGLLRLGQALAGRRVAVVVSGGNIDPSRWCEVLADGRDQP